MERKVKNNAAPALGILTVLTLRTLVAWCAVVGAGCLCITLTDSDSTSTLQHVYYIYILIYSRN